MKQPKRIVSLTVALVLFLTPTLTFALTLNVDNGNLTFTDTGYKQEGEVTTETAYGTDTAVVVISESGATTNTVTVTNTGSAASVTVTGEIVYNGTGSFLTAAGNVDNLTLKDAVVSASGVESGPTVNIAREADVELNMDNATVSAGNTGSAMQVDGDLNVSVSGESVVSGNENAPALDIGASGEVTVSSGVLNLIGDSAGGTVAGDAGSTLAATGTGTVVAKNDNREEYKQPVQGVHIDGTQTTSSAFVDGTTYRNTTTVRAESNPPANPSGNPPANPPGNHQDDPLEIHISSDPDDVIAYIPLGDMSSENLSINGVGFEPDITPDKYIKLEGGDLLMATLINGDPQFFEGLEVGEPPIKENIFIRHGNAYLSLSDGSHMNLYEQASKSAIRLMKKSMEERSESGTQSGNEDWNFSNYQAMKLLEGQKYSINADDQNLINLGIGNVWQAPVPDKDYDPLSQYVPPEVPPNTSPEGEPEEELPPD